MATFREEYTQLYNTLNSGIFLNAIMGGNRFDILFREEGRLYGWDIQDDKVTRPRCVFEWSGKKKGDTVGGGRWSIWNEAGVLKRFKEKNPPGTIRTKAEEWNYDFYNAGLVVIRRMYSWFYYKKDEDTTVTLSDFPDLGMAHIITTFPKDVYLQPSDLDYTTYYALKDAADKQGIPPGDPGYPVYPQPKKVKRFKRVLEAKSSYPSTDPFPTDDQLKPVVLEAFKVARTFYPVYCMWDPDPGTYVYGAVENNCEYIRSGSGTNEKITEIRVKISKWSESFDIFGWGSWDEVPVSNILFYDIEIPGSNITIPIPYICPPMPVRDPTTGVTPPWPASVTVNGVKLTFIHGTR
jgi:hypothetical protein